MGSHILSPSQSQPCTYPQVKAYHCQLRQGLLCLPGACSTFKVLLEPLDSLEEHKGNEVLKRRVRSGDMLGVRNPELSLRVVEITQSLKPLKAEARFCGEIHGKVIGPHPVLSRIMYLDSSVS